MKQVILNILMIFTLIAVLSGNPYKEYSKDSKLKPYYKILMLSNGMRADAKALVDSFIKVDQVINIRKDYYTMILRKP